MRTVDWKDGKIVIIDKLSLPNTFRTIEIDSVERLGDAIKRMEVHGAPAIGAAAAYGMALAAIRSGEKDPDAVKQDLTEARDYLAQTRPTAVNLFEALGQMLEFGLSLIDSGKKDQLAEQMLEKAKGLSEREIQSSKKLAAYGMELIPEGTNIITHCHTGPLSTVDIGLSMAPVIEAHKKGRKVHVYTCETRPMLQGARHNVWDLHHAGVPYTLITDSTAALLMQKGKVDMFIFGVDRMAANGDTAAKIGVYGLSVLAKYHHIPVYPILPLSSIDWELPSGDGIPIEQRDPDEVRKIKGTYITLPEAPVENYAFDVTPHELLTAIVTDRGIAKPPFKENLAALQGSA